MQSHNNVRALPDPLERLARRRAGMRMGWLAHLLVFVAVNLLLAVVAASSGRNWAVFPLLGWGLGLAIHGGVVFLVTGGLGLQDRLVQKERERMARTASRSESAGAP